MSRPASSNAPLGILLFLTASWGLSRLGNVLADDAIVWQLGAVLDALTIALAVTLAVTLAPYSALRSKSVLAALASASWLELLYLTSHYLAGINNYNYWLVGQFVTGGAVVGFYWFRPYYRPSDPLDDTHMFLVCRRPHTLQGFLLSLSGFFGAYGGFSIYAKGLLYTYRAGKLRALPFTPNDAYSFYIRRGGILTNDQIKALQDMTGKQWTIAENCLSLRKLWGHYNGMVKGTG